MRAWDGTLLMGLSFITSAACWDMSDTSIYSRLPAYRHADGADS
jgi:hypothetical protein